MGWFPLTMDLVEGRENFKKLTPMGKLFYFFLMSEYNRRGKGFYLSDIRASVTLSLSTKTLQRRRAELIQAGLVTALRGSNTFRGQNIATRYIHVKYAIKPDGHFAQIKHHALHAMLHQLRKGKFDHADLVVYFYLYYLSWKYRGESKGVVIFKSTLSELTGIKDAHLRVKRLYDGFLFSDDKHLFEYRDLHQKFIFTDWAYFPDPEKNEHARKHMEFFKGEIDAMVREKRDFKAMAYPPVSLQAKRRR
jgi:hypothetical protein